MKIESKNRSLFDNYAESYEGILEDQLSFFNPNRDYFSAYKIKIIANFITTSPNTILDFGCGVGLSLPHLRNYFPGSKVYAIDSSPKSIDIVRDRYPHVEVFEDVESNVTKFDLIFLSCVMHHIPANDRRQAIQDVSHLLKPNGVLCIFEHNPYNPITRRIVSTCPFDKGVELLSMGQLTQLATSSAGLELLKKGYCLFFPQLINFMSFTEKFIRWLPLGGQYFVFLTPSQILSTP